MKRSAIVTLAISGAIIISSTTGCDRGYDGQQIAEDYDTTQPMTNNTYHASHGYWHAPYREWYPYPYNYYEPGRGYFYGGSWSASPHVSSVTTSVPRASGRAVGTSSHIVRGGFGGHSSSVAG